MKKKFLTALMLSAVLIFSGVSNSEAAHRTKITLTVAHNPTREVSGDLIDSRGVYRGSGTGTRNFTDQKGRRVTKTETEFRNVKGELLMSADVAITARADEFTVKQGEVFSETLSVDVRTKIFVKGYDEYRYSLGIEGLPEWLNVTGEVSSSDSVMPGTSGHHHEFVINGTPETVSRSVMRFTADVYISGDVPVMMASGSMDVTVSAEAVPKPPDVVPKSDDVSPDVVPKSDDISPDVVPKSEDVQPGVADDGTYVIGDDSGNGVTGTLAEFLSNMTPEQKAAIKTLKIGGNITDLSGINELVNLETLDLRDAVMLEAVDLRGNSSLKSVDIKGNTALRTLNISGSRVEELDSSGCANLEEIDVSGCTELRTLKVSRTNITALNAEGCVKLEVLDCSDCRLEDLNITGCDSLNVLDCSNNRLHRLDVYMLMRLIELRCENQTIHVPVLGRVLNLMEYLEGISESHLGTAAESSDNGAENVINIRAWDSSGNEVTVEYDLETGTASFGGTPAKIAYDYITGFEDVRMDVAVFADDSEEAYGTINPRGSGCNAAAVLPLLMVILLITAVEVKFHRRI